ncbi:MAG TPA: PAS domain S-box protein [Bacteroidota bacterium]
MAKPLRVLIVEDSADDALLLVNELKNGGYQSTFERVDTNEGLKTALAQKEWDCIISDYSLPQFSGLAALREVQDRGVDIPFILVSGTIGEEIAVEAMKSGAQDYIMKDKLGRLVPAIDRELAEVEVRRKRRQAEKALQLSIRKYKDIFNFAPIGIYQSSSDGRFITMNWALAEILGYESPEMMMHLNMRTDVYLYQEQHDALIALHESEASADDLEIQWKNKGGTPVWIQLNSHPVRDAHGKNLHYEGFVRNITERKRAEQELQKSEKRYRDLIESSLVGVYTTNLRGEILFVNDAMARMLEYHSRQECMQGTALSWYKNPDDRNRLIESLKEHRSIHGLEVEFLTRNGTAKTILLSATLDGDVLSGMVSDITQRKVAEESLRQSEERFRLISENVIDMIAVLDIDGKRLYNSPSYKPLLGSDLEALHGTNSFAEIHAEDRERIKSLFNETVRTGVGQRAEYRLVRNDGTVRFIESQGSVISDAGGKTSKVVIVSRDITERKRLEEQFLHAQKMESIGTLAGGIAHDFNNVLAIILGYLSLIGKGKVEPDKLSHAIDTMTAAVQRGAGLVRQLLTFARKSEVLLEPVIMNETVKEIVDMCTQTFPKTISCSIELDIEIPAVITDKNQLHQAILNLCVNARDAMNGDGSLAITTSVVKKAVIQERHTDATFDEYVCITISDTGSGMDAATKARIFEPFFTTKGVGKGTGLGLAMVYGFINRHRGFIDVESSPGKGTTFFLYFPAPASGEPTLQVKEDVDGVVSGGKETILFAEDEESLRELVKTMLESKGYKVLIAEDGVQAVEVFASHVEEIALVLTDLGLSRLDGWEAFQKMKKIKPEISAIVATGYIDAGSRSDMLSRGAKDIIQKPYMPNKLLKSVRAALDSLEKIS